MEQHNDTALFMEKFRLLLDTGETLPLPVQGNSMAPFLVDRRDMVWIQKQSGKPLKIGDIVLYQRDSGRYILHRIHRIRQGTYTMVGDAHHVTEPGIRPDQIIGRVVRIRRKGRIREPNACVWLLFSKIWIRMVPMRPLAMGVYACLSKPFRR